MKTNNKNNNSIIKEKKALTAFEKTFKKSLVNQNQEDNNPVEIMDEGFPFREHNDNNGKLLNIAVDLFSELEHITTIRYQIEYNLEKIDVCEIPKNCDATIEEMDINIFDSHINSIQTGLKKLKRERQ